MSTNRFMKKYPLVSIIITTYNRRLLLPYAIQSVLNQTYSNYEIIIVNDCGEDVWDIIESFKSDKIKYLSHIKNSGLPFARNTGIKVSKGEILCYLDDDDLFLENHLDILVDAYENNDVDIVYTDALLVLEKIVNNERIIVNIQEMFNIPNFRYQQLQIQNFIPINTISHKKSILSKTGLFVEELSSLEDWEFLLRLGKHNDFYHISRSTVEVRRNVESKNNMLSKEQIKAVKMYKKIYNLHKVNQDYVEAQRSLVLLRIIKDNILIKKSLGFAISQVFSIQKELGRFIYYSLFPILKIKRQKNG